jgi:hypothetical protein
MYWKKVIKTPDAIFHPPVMGHATTDTNMPRKATNCGLICSKVSIVLLIADSWVSLLSIDYNKTVSCCEILTFIYGGMARTT